MVVGSRNAAVPPSLRPKTATGAARPKRQLHAAVVTQDVRVRKFLLGKCFLMGPSDLDVELTLHVFQQDPAHSAMALDGYVRWAMVENGLILPEQAGLVVPVDVEVGMEPRP
jgi:hypothetical protein